MELEDFTSGGAYPVKVVIRLSECVEESVEAFDIDVPDFFIDLLDKLLMGVSFLVVENLAELRLFVRDCHFLSQDFALKLHDKGREFILFGAVIFGESGKLDLVNIKWAPSWVSLTTDVDRV